MADTNAAIKAALQQILALADRALDKKLMDRKPKPPPPAPEEEQEEAPGEEPMTPEDEEELAALYDKE